jgi:coenzyme F420-reducing hydrogenase delta subunit
LAKILVIHCTESGKAAFQRMAQLGLRLSEDIRTFELPCTGRVNEVLLMESLQNGVTGVMIVGCRKDNCRHLDGNLRAAKRVARVAKLLKDAGIRDKSVVMHFTSPDEGKRLHGALREYHESIAEKIVTKEPR